MFEKLDPALSCKVLYYETNSRLNVFSYIMTVNMLRPWCTVSTEYTKNWLELPKFLKCLRSFPHLEQSHNEICLAKNLNPNKMINVVTCYGMGTMS